MQVLKQKSQNFVLGNYPSFGIYIIDESIGLGVKGHTEKQNESESHIMF